MDARSRHRLSRKACESRRARVFEEARRARSVEPEAGATLASRRAAVAAYFAADIKDVLAMGQAPATEEPRRDALGRLRTDLARGPQLAILDEKIPILAAAAAKDGGRRSTSPSSWACATRASAGSR